EKLPDHALGVEAPVGSKRQVVNAAENENVGDVAGGHVPLPPSVVTVRYRKIRHRTGQYRRIENGGGLINQLRSRITEEKRQASRESFLQLGLQPVVIGVAHVVAK